MFDGHVEIVGQRQVLIDGLDAERLGGARVVDFDFAAVELDRSGILLRPRPTGS